MSSSKDSASTTPDDRLLEALVHHYCTTGAFAGDDPEAHRPRIAFNLGLGQWVSMRDAAGEVLAWMAWWRVSDVDLAALRVLGPARMMAMGWLPEVRTGAHCYIADAVSLPQAPRGALWWLLAQVKQRNPDAASFSYHFNRRRRPTSFRWEQR